MRGYSKKHGSSHWTIRKWIKEENIPCKKHKKKTKILTEIERLKLENEQLKMENIVLKSFHQAVIRYKKKKEKYQVIVPLNPNKKSHTDSF